MSEQVLKKKLIQYFLLFFKIKFSFIGSLNYLAPEAFENNAAGITSAVDIWAMLILIKF